MTMSRIPALSVACLALTSLSIATLGTPNAVADAVKTARADAATLRTDAAAMRQPAQSRSRPSPMRSLPALGPSPVTGTPGSEFEDGLPVLTRRGVRSLRVGDPLSLPTPDGDVIRYTVETKGFTDADASETYLASGGRESTYGIIVQRGAHLAGYLQRVDGRAYKLMPGRNGAYRLERMVSHGDRECGVGRVDLADLDAGANGAAQGGVAGGTGVSPCPPEVLPFQVPIGLRKDSGILIDVLFVFTQDAAELAAEQGRDIRTLAQLAVSQTNLAMRRSTEQPVVDFDGQAANEPGSQPLNPVCGYSEGGFPNGTGPDCHFSQAAPNPGPPTGMAGTCKDDESDPLKRTVHITLPAVSPAEQDTCLPRVRLVAALVADGFFGQESPYNGTGLAIDLSRVSNPADGYMDYVPVWRDALGADAVCLVGLGYGSDSGFVGLASVMNDINDPSQGAYFPLGPLYGPVPLTGVGNPYPIVDLTKMPNPSTPFLNDPTDPGSVGTWGTPVDPSISTLQEFQESPYSLLDYTTIDDLVFAHELGHNMGCQHNHNDGSPSRNALFPDSFGYRTEGGGGAGAEGFKTVMSYGNQTRLPGYSNPNVTWRALSGNNPDVPTEEAGIAFDFACTEIDGDGTDVRYRRGTGFNVVSCARPTAEEACEDETDEERTSTDSSPMVIAANVEVEQQLDTDQSGGANNARSISQIKFDFAKFRCSVFPVVDCNDDEVDDFLQAVDGLVDDCNANGVPDECETVQDPGSASPTDCNGNGTPDQCDIDSGESFDDNVNLIPDECEDRTALFSETFERVDFGLVEGALPIAKVSDEALKELRKLDPDFPDFFATIETVGLAQAPGNGGYVYFNVQPSAFQYRLGGNGERPCPDFVNGQVSATRGFATAIGARGYGQALNFDSATGDFPSQAGITTITAARDCKEVRFFVNAADFTGYFDYEPPLPLLNNYPYLRENLIFISAFNEAGELVYEQTLDVRGQWRPQGGFCSEIPNPQGMVFVRVGAPLGSDIELEIRRVEVRGAFVVMDNISFDAGLDNSAIPCVADIAGGPFDPSGTPTPDGRVGGEDLLVVLAAFGYGREGSPQFSTCPPEPPIAGEQFPRLADINDDCVVDGMDLLEVLAAWGQCLGGTP